MLVLTRKLEESIIIGDGIEVRVVEISGEKVKLGIVAPKTVSVHRKEIYDAIQKENITAAASPARDMRDIAKTLGIKTSKK